MLEGKGEALGSMGIDRPLAVLSDVPQPTFNYFKELFAQVTNPPIDPIRESLVTSTSSLIGPEQDLTESSAEQARRIVVDSPVLTVPEMEGLKQYTGGGARTKVIDTTFAVAEGKLGLQRALARINAEATNAVNEGYTTICLSDRAAGPTRVSTPSLLATGAV
ncbi:MAG TPA: glutamate synthase central domain-containing protein, partial [Candidatus Obscuribacterales bacterium]